MVISHDIYLFIGTSDYLMLGARRWVSPSHPLWKFTDVSGLQVLETEYQSNSPSPVVAIPAPKALQDQRFPPSGILCSARYCHQKRSCLCVFCLCTIFFYKSACSPLHSRKLAFWDKQFFYMFCLGCIQCGIPGNIHILWMELSLAHLCGCRMQTGRRGALVSIYLLASTVSPSPSPLWIGKRRQGQRPRSNVGE